MKIIELKAENFKRLRAVSIKPDGTLQQITGRNAQGKTSVLDAVWAALGGKDASPERPVRDGADRARVSVDLGDVCVTRKWSADGKSTLAVESKDGASYKSPQAMLDKLVGSLTFDPLAFVRAAPKEQAETLRRIAGFDTRAIDDKRRGAFERRTEANRALKQQQGALEALPIIDAPDEPVSVFTLLEELAAAESKLCDRVLVISREKQTAVQAQSAREAEEALGRQLEEAKMRRNEAEQRHRDATKAVAELAAVDPDPAEIRDRIRSAEDINARVRQRQTRTLQVAAVTKANDAAAAFTAEIDRLDAEKAALLAAAKFPVPGLSVDGDTPTFNNVPLSQSSGAEQLRVGLAVAAALNPTLRTVLVRDGSLLDKEGLELVAAWAAEHDMQVLLERVADGTRVGVVIEDGMVDEADLAEVAS